jgi:hypothetical protein
LKVLMHSLRYSEGDSAVGANERVWVPRRAPWSGPSSLPPWGGDGLGRRGGPPKQRGMFTGVWELETR